jgi:cysteine synthase A
MTVVEYSGGSTGSSLAFVCAVKGYDFKCVSSDAFAVEKLETMEAFGAELIMVPSEGGMTSPDLIPRMMQKAKSITRSEDCYFTNQLHNSDIIFGHRKIGKELLQQVDRPIDAFCGGVGTAGSHDVEGIGIGYTPPLLDAELYRGIDEQQSRRAARLLAREEGIFAGTSSGLNVVAALQLAAELGPGKTVVTVAVDTGLKYLATDIYSV